MDRDEALKLLMGGPEGISEWRRRRANNEDIPSLDSTDLRGADLRKAYVSWANLSGADLSGADLSWAELRGTKLFEANLSRLDLRQADLSEAHLRGADLSGAFLREANLREADLRGANFRGADLRGANFSGAKLFEADLSEACCWLTTFANVDLSEVKGLDSISHAGPSTVGTDTLIRSQAQIPESFLRGCGVPEYLIENQKAIVGSLEPIQFYSCFISYSTKNQEFAERLHSKMRDKGLRVWFSPEDIQGGKKLHEQIDEAIRIYDKLLLVLSRDSMESEWVKTEIYNARKAEIKEGKRKLFPIRLVDFDALRDWKCFDADSGKDLAREIREYFIPDFSNWKDHDSFEAAFARLLNDLKAEESTGVKPA
jgi:hypothetical protein